jgi:hypothetical protein
MKKLNSLNLGKSLNREEMKTVLGGLNDPNINEGYCTCGTKPKKLTSCGCMDYCNGTCSEG